MINNLPCQAHRSLLHPHVLLLWLESAQVIMMMVIKIMKMVITTLMATIRIVMMTTLIATIRIVMMTMTFLRRGPASPADSPAMPTPRGLDPIALDRWVGNHTVLVFLHLQVSRVDSKLSFSSGGRKAFALDSQGLPMRTNMMTYGDLMRSSLVTPCQKCVSFLKIRNNFLASKSH